MLSKLGFRIHKLSFLLENSPLVIWNLNSINYNLIDDAICSKQNANQAVHLKWRVPIPTSVSWIKLSGIIILKIKPVNTAIHHGYKVHGRETPCRGPLLWHRGYKCGPLGQSCGDQCFFVVSLKKLFKTLPNRRRFATSLFEKNNDNDDHDDTSIWTVANKSSEMWFHLPVLIYGTYLWCCITASLLF